MTRLWAAAIFLCLFPAAVWAGPNSAKAVPGATAADPAAPRGAISISADQMESVDKDKVVIFTGNVITRQEELVVNCDRMKVYYQDSGAWPGGAGPAASLGTAPDRETRIDRLVAEGNVKITKGTQVALAGMAVYEARKDKRKIILTGQPRVWNEKDFLSGKRITYYLDEDRSVVEGGEKERVNAIFYQEPSGGKIKAKSPAAPPTGWE
ncbi:MAG: LptA/OstA family protein [Pseudomonadota bacterium]